MTGSTASSTPSVVVGDPYPNYYETAYAQLISSYGDLVKKVMDQNTKLEEQMVEYTNLHSTDYQKSIYENESTAYLKNTYTTMLYIFYFVVGITLIYGFYKGVFSLKTPGYLMLMVFLIVFPYIIFTIESILYSLIKYVWDILTENVFPNVYLENDY